MSSPGEYKPSPWGAKFHALKVDEALGGGSAGPGKTTALIADPSEQIVVEHTRCLKTFDPKSTLMVSLATAAAAKLGWDAGRMTTSEFADAWTKECFHEPGSSTAWVLHLRRLAKSLEQSIEKFRLMFSHIDPRMHWDAQNTKGIFWSGLKYQFGHCKDPDGYLPFYSSEFTYLAMDELNQFLENQYNQLSTRVRSSDWLLRRMLKIRSMSNPTILRGNDENFVLDDPFWVRKRFVDPAPQGGVVLKRRINLSDGTIRWRTRLYLPARLRDNPDKQFALDYEFRLKDQRPHIRQALLDADWYVTAGAYYSDAWLPNIHVCDPFAIPSDWPVYRAMDWGFKTPGCIYWAAMDPDGTLYVFREYTFRGKTASEVAERVHEIEEEEGLWKDGRSTITGPADTQLWEQRGETGRSKSEEFSRKGVNWVQADKRSRARNAERLYERLNSHQDGQCAPGIVFFNTCRRAIQTIPAIPTDLEAEIPVPMKGGDDHWHECIGYLCAYLSRIEPGSLYDKEDDDGDPGDGGGFGRDGYGGRY